MPTAREVLTPEALAMLETIALKGSFAAAARAAHMALALTGIDPSVLTKN